MAQTSLTVLLLMMIITIDHVRPEIFFIAERLPLQGDRPSPGSPWPLPKDWQRQDWALQFTPANLNLTSNLHSCDIIDQAFSRFQRRCAVVQEDRRLSRGANGMEEEVDDTVETNGTDRIDEYDIKVAGFLHDIRVVVENVTCPGYPQYGHEENYTLDILDSVELRAPSVWGALLGLETLSQLMYMVDGTWYINQGHVIDAPRFKVRGLHLDTARHFYPMDFLKTTLDIMLSNKLNVFHWHIVDAQSFPYVSTTFPELSEKGAFTPRHVYSQNDVQELIEYARLRGIRVLPEFDTPGHAHSWGKAMPELLTPCWAGGEPEKANYSFHAERENFDPSKNTTFEFLESFFEEIVHVFKDNYLHLGFDEAHYMCWESSPNISDFMRSIGLRDGDYPGLEQYYSNRVLDIISRTDKKPIVWEDAINRGQNISKDTVIQLWKHLLPPPNRFGPWENYTVAALRSGYDVILSSCWYISDISYGQDWTKFYSCDPYHIDATDEQKSHILGGVVGTWSEYIDEVNGIQIMWPRASAVAERLWSPAEFNDTNNARFRLDQHRCRYFRQGISAAPISPGFCQSDYNTDNSLIHHPVHRQQQLQHQTTQTAPVDITVTERSNTGGKGNRAQDKDNSARRISCPGQWVIVLVIACACTAIRHLAS